MTLRWAALVLAAGALLIASCGGGSKAQAPTPTAPPSHSPTEAAASGAFPTPAFPPSQEHPYRWGYNPREFTDVPDPLPVLKALPAGYRIETYVSGLVQPTNIAFLPDGRMLVTEQAGSVRLVVDGQLQPEPYFQPPNVFFPESEDVIELGLVTIAVDPDFAQNGYVYIYYTTDQPERRTVLARITDAGTRATGLSEILSLDASPTCCHISGSMRFAPDGTMFLSVGDHQREEAAQDIGEPFGKILHINRDGTPAAGNPFADEDDADPRVWAYGLRNPFDFAIHPTQGRIFATENGFLGQDAVVEIRPGANYGWPGYDLAVPLDEIELPLLFYQAPTGPSGMELYLADALPELTGMLLFCQFHRGGALHAVTFTVTGEVAADFVIAPGCTSDVLTGPDGFIYFVDYVGGVVYRIARG